MTPTVGVSLKMYFGYDQTLRWCHDVAGRLARNGPLNRGEVRLFVLPGFLAIPAAAELFRGTPIMVGAQNIFPADSGAFTGEVSGPMLREAGARYVEVGHAERRVLFGEDEATVSDKTAAVLRNGMVPVLCLGEADRVPAATASAECARQLSSALRGSELAGLSGPIVIAYEPFWAIGAAQPAADAHITEVCAVLREAIQAYPAHPGSAVIYGGSAGPGLWTRLGTGIDGLFLGRFAHDPEVLSGVLDEGVRSWSSA